MQPDVPAMVDELADLFCDGARAASETARCSTLLNCIRWPARQPPSERQASIEAVGPQQLLRSAQRRADAQAEKDRDETLRPNRAREELSGTRQHGLRAAGF